MQIASGKMPVGVCIWEQGLCLCKVKGSASVNFKITFEYIKLPTGTLDGDVLLRVVRSATLLSDKTRTVVSKLLMQNSRRFTTWCQHSHCCGAAPGTPLATAAAVARFLQFGSSPARQQMQGPYIHLSMIIDKDCMVT